MKQCIRSMAYTLCLIISIPLRGDCNSCNVTPSNSLCCSKNACVKFKRKTAAFCTLYARDLEAQLAYLNNATIRNLRVFGDETIDGSLVVNGLATIDGDLTITGTFDGLGATIPPLALTQYAYFIRNADQVIANNGFVTFNANGFTPTSGITLSGNAIVFAEAGTYLISYVTTGNGFGNKAWTLANDPNGVPSNIANSGIAQGANTNLVSLYIILQVTAGQEIGLRNVSGVAQTITTNPAPGTDLSNAAAITILKLN